MSTPIAPQRLLGRKPETVAAHDVLAEARQGRGRMIVVSGEAGIGTSAVLDAVLRDADNLGFATLASRAIASGGSLRPISEALVPAIRHASITDSPALQPFRFALSRLLPGWHQDAPAAVMDPTVLLGEAVLALLSVLYPDRPSILVVDDMQWADVETLALVEYLASAVRRLPVAVAVGLRSNDPGVDPVLNLARRTDALVLELGPLSDDDVATVVKERVGGGALPEDVTAFVALEAEGLPLLAEELIDGLIRSGTLVEESGAWRVTRELSARIPHTLSELARTRLAEIGTPHGRDVVIAAAVIGRTVDWELLATVLDLDEAQIEAGIDAAVDLQLLERTASPASSYRWRHGLLREAILSHAQQREVRRLSRRAADALTAATASFGLSAETDQLVVELLLQAGDADAAARRLVALAGVSMQRGAMRAAEASLDRAQALSADPGVRGDADLQRIRLLTLTGRGRDAVGAADAVLSGVEGAPRDRLLVALARAAVGTGEWTTAIGFLDRVSSAVVDGPQVAAVRADAHYGAGRLGLARQIASAAVQDLALAETPELLSGAYEVLARCARMEDPEESARLFQRAADVAESASLAPARVRALFGLGSARLLAGDDMTFFLQVRELALDAGLLAEAAGVDLMVGEDLWLCEGPARALPTVVAAADLAEMVGLDELRAVCLMMEATCHASQGNTDAATAAMDRIADDIANPDVFSLRHVVRALDLLFGRDLSGAGAELDASIALVREHESSGPLPHWGLWAVVRTALGDGAAARDEVRSSVFVTREVNRGGLQYADAIASGRDGHGAEAVELMAAGDATMARQHWWRRSLRLVVHQAAIADGWGDPAKGLRADLAGFEADGSLRQASTARDLLRAAGASVPRRGRGDSVIPPRLRAMGVTSREGDVLVLVAQGLTNADIAQRLFLSVRTVETHVANLLAKTGSTDRTGLAPYAAELSP